MYRLAIFLGLLTLAFVSKAVAQDACTTELQQLNAMDIANKQNLNTVDVCRYVANEIKILKARAALYRRCQPGFAGEEKAHEFEATAAKRMIVFTGGSCSNSKNLLQ